MCTITKSTDKIPYANMTAVRIVCMDYYMSAPMKGIDPQNSVFRGSSIAKLPIIRIFGSADDGRKVCLHVHGAFPYIYVPHDGTEDPKGLAYRLASGLDKALNISQGQASSAQQHVYEVAVVSAIPIYGYHAHPRPFFKISFYNPQTAKRACALLQNGSVLGRPHQPHEAHIPYHQQFMIDYNLHGMNLIKLGRVRHRADESENVKILTDVKKMSVCSLEMDARAEDILNTFEIGEVNPGIEHICEEERARRRDAGEDAQPSKFLTSERSMTPEAAASSEKFRILLSGRLADAPPTGESQDSLFDLSCLDSTAINEDADFLMSMLKDNEGAEDDSVLSQREKREDDDEEPDLGVPLASVTTPVKVLLGGIEEDGEDDIWNDSFFISPEGGGAIAQVDGGSDRNFEVAPTSKFEVTSTPKFEVASISKFSKSQSANKRNHNDRDEGIGSPLKTSKYTTDSKLAQSEKRSDCVDFEDKPSVERNTTNLTSKPSSEDEETRKSLGEHEVNSGSAEEMDCTSEAKKCSTSRPNFKIEQLDGRNGSSSSEDEARKAAAAAARKRSGRRRRRAATSGSSPYPALQVVVRSPARPGISRGSGLDDPHLGNTGGIQSSGESAKRKLTFRQLDATASEEILSCRYAPARLDRLTGVRKVDGDCATDVGKVTTVITGSNTTRRSRLDRLTGVKKVESGQATDVGKVTNAITGNDTLLPTCRNTPVGLDGLTGVKKVESGQATDVGKVTNAITGNDTLLPTCRNTPVGLDRLTGVKKVESGQATDVGKVTTFITGKNTRRRSSPVRLDGLTGVKKVESGQATDVGKVTNASTGNDTLLPSSRNTHVRLDGLTGVKKVDDDYAMNVGKVTTVFTGNNTRRRSGPIRLDGLTGVKKVESGQATDVGKVTNAITGNDTLLPSSRNTPARLDKLTGVKKVDDDYAMDVGKVTTVITDNNTTRRSSPVRPDRLTGVKKVKSGQATDVGKVTTVVTGNNTTCSNSPVGLDGLTGVKKVESGQATDVGKVTTVITGNNATCSNSPIRLDRLTGVKKVKSGQATDVGKVTTVVTGNNTTCSNSPVGLDGLTGVKKVESGQATDVGKVTTVITGNNATCSNSPIRLDRLTGVKKVKSGQATDVGKVTTVITGNNTTCRSSPVRLTGVKKVESGQATDVGKVTTVITGNNTTCRSSPVRLTGVKKVDGDYATDVGNVTTVITGNNTTCRSSPVRLTGVKKVESGQSTDVGKVTSRNTPVRLDRLTGVEKVDGDYAMDVGKVTTVITGNNTTCRSSPVRLTGVKNVESDYATDVGKVTTVITGNNTTCRSSPVRLTGVKKVESGQATDVGKVTTVITGNNTTCRSSPVRLTGVKKVESGRATDVGKVTSVITGNNTTCRSSPVTLTGDKKVESDYAMDVGKVTSAITGNDTLLPTCRNTPVRLDRLTGVVKEDACIGHDPIVGSYGDNSNDIFSSETSNDDAHAQQPAADRYDAAVRYVPAPGPSRDARIVISGGTSSSSGLPPTPNRDVTLKSSAAEANVTPFSDADDDASVTSLLPHSQQDTLTSSASGALLRDLTVTELIEDDLISARKTSEGHCVLVPRYNPPSADLVRSTMGRYGVAEVRNEDPYYSDPVDITGSVEVGRSVLKIKSRTTVDLDDFKSDYRGFAKTGLNDVAGDAGVVVKMAPAKAPPGRREVELWAKARSIREGGDAVMQVQTRRREKVRCFIDEDGDCSEGDLSLTLSPCTPVEVDRKVESPTENSSTNDSLQRVLEQSRLFRVTGSQGDASHRISGASLDNTHGFKFSLENYQNVRSRVVQQHLTTLVVELHVDTRGALLPDPELDAIAAIFYAKLDDGGAAEVGLVAVNADEVLPGTGYTGAAIHAGDELELYALFLDLVRKWDPDVFIGYEVETSSWGYLVERGYKLGLNYGMELSRVPREKPRTREDDPELTITGRIVLDLWRLLRHELPLTGYTFENVVYHVLHERAAAFAAQDLTNWWVHKSPKVRSRTVDYYAYRVRAVLRLLDHFDLLGRTSELARLFGILFYEVLSRGSQFRVESMMLRLAKPANYVAVSPSVQQRARMRAPEFLPLILEPESKFYKDPVVVLDFQSLYPSMIIAYNYCFSTCVGRCEHLVNSSRCFEFGACDLRMSRARLRKLLEEDVLHFSPPGIGFVRASVRDGVLPRMLREILDARLLVKDAMKRTKANKTLQRVLHSRQLGLKLIANVTYGYTAANFSGRMPAVEIGDSVVAKGRETLQRAIKMVETTGRWGARVVYGDTDSLFVLVPGRSRAEAFRIGAEIAEAVTASNPSPVRLKLEKVYQPCVLQTKKRYVGYAYESPEQETPDFDAKGIETVRRDGCPAVGKMLEKCLRMLFETRDVSAIKRYVQRQFHKLLSGRASVQDLIFAKEYRGEAGYKQGACVPALELAKKWKSVDRRKEPRRGQRVPYVIVNGPPGLPLIRLVRSPSELLNDPSLRPNALYYITKVIVPPINRCFLLIGADLNTWFNEMPRRRVQCLPTSSPTKAKKSTISQYFATTSCACCSRQTRDGLCPRCADDPQSTAAVLYEKVGEWEGSHNQTYKICQSCCGRMTEIPCVSLDCPVLYRLVQTGRDAQQADFVRDLIGRRLPPLDF